MKSIETETQTYGLSVSEVVTSIIGLGAIMHMTALSRADPQDFQKTCALVYSHYSQQLDRSTGN